MVWRQRDVLMVRVGVELGLVSLRKIFPKVDGSSNGNLMGFSSLKNLGMMM